MLMRTSKILPPPHIFAGLTHRGYGSITIDAPQRFKSYTALQAANWNSRRDVEKHYECLTIEEIASLPIKDLAHPGGCHLWLWITGPNLHRARELIEAWGFRYSAIGFVWVKLRRGLKQTPLFFSERDLHVGLGLTTRHNVELCLLARRGNARRNAKDVREVILAPVREHSRKPDEFFARVERYSSGPFLELFARERRSGWDAWGDELDKFNGIGGASSPPATLRGQP
jgi:N6-adenosine-specific RNA methylase IME4